MGELFYIMNKKEHDRLLQDFIKLGGQSRLVKSLAPFSLANHAKLKHQLRQLQPEQVPLQANAPEADPEPTITLVPRKSIFSDLISQYPPQLHTAYKRRYDCWLEACSLKVQLNDIGPEDEKEAAEIQEKILSAMRVMDKCQEALAYYQENKRIIPVETKKTFDHLSPVDLIKMRNNIRSNITKRTATLEKMVAEGAADHMLGRKREQLAEIINQLEELNKIINDK